MTSTADPTRQRIHFSHFVSVTSVTKAIFQFVFFTSIMPSPENQSQRQNTAPWVSVSSAVQLPRLFPVKWEESFRATKVPLAKSLRLFVMESSSKSGIKKKDRKRKWKSRKK